MEEFPCENKDQLRARERYYIENTECINKYIPNRTKREYYLDNKTELLKYHKEYYGLNKEQKQQYYQTNKEHIKEYNNQRYYAKKEQQNEELQQNII
jgi:hypothetical protein